MTETRCEPPEELRGVAGFHWLQRPDGTSFLAEWEIPEWWPDTHGAWRIGPGAIVPAPAYRKGYRYDSRVLTPAEVATLKAERDAAVAKNEALRLAIQGGEDAPGHASSIPMAVILDNARKLRVDAAQGWDAATLRAEVGRLREALERIATMPWKDAPATEFRRAARKIANDATRAALEPQP
jgi:hypothetical protein